MPRRVRYANRRRRGVFRRRRRIYRRGYGRSATSNLSRLRGSLTNFGGAAPYVVRAPGVPLPSRMRVKMRVQGEHYFTSASPQKMTFAINHAREPLGGAAGISTNQHRGWDQISLLYQRCIVLTARVIVEALNVDGLEACQVGLCFTAGAAIPDSGSRRIAEFPYSRVAVLPVTMTRPAILISSCNILDMFGGGLGRHIPQEFAATTTGSDNPDRSVFLNICANTFDSGGTNAVRYMIVVEQVIEFYDPTPVSVS